MTRERAEKVPSSPVEPSGAVGRTVGAPATTHRGVQGRFPHCDHSRLYDTLGCFEERHGALHTAGCPDDPTCPGAVPVPDESETT